MQELYRTGRKDKHDKHKGILAWLARGKGFNCACLSNIDEIRERDFSRRTRDSKTRCKCKYERKRKEKEKEKENEKGVLLPLQKSRAQLFFYQSIDRSIGVMQGSI